MWEEITAAKTYKLEEEMIDGLERGCWLLMAVRQLTMRMLVFDGDIYYARKATALRPRESKTDAERALAELSSSLLS